MKSSEIYHVVQEVRKARGLNAKMEILGAFPGMQKITRTTYSPYIHFNIKASHTWCGMPGAGGFDEAGVNQLLNNLASGRLTGNKAKIAILETLKALDIYSQELLILVLNKDFKWGLQATSINKVFPGLIPVFPVQLAETYKPNKFKFPNLISPKIDGLRCVYIDGVMRSRKGHLLHGLEHISSFIKSNMPAVRRLDGEIQIPGMAFEDSSGNIRSFKKSDEAVYRIFDSFGDTKDAPLYWRIAGLHVISTFVDVPFISMVPHTTVTSEAHAMELYEQYRSMGYEGAILKNQNAGEVVGRTWDWCKLKPKDTADCIVEALYMGEGKYENSVGSLVVDFNGKKCNVGGGMTDAQRAAWAEDPNLIIGKTIEVEYMELTKYGVMRHPRMKKVRGDK